MYFSYLEDLRQHLRVAHNLNNRFKLVIGWFETYYGSRQYILKRNPPLPTGDGYNDELTALGDLSLVDPVIIRRTLNRMIQKGNYLDFCQLDENEDDFFFVYCSYFSNFNSRCG